MFHLCVCLNFVYALLQKLKLCLLDKVAAAALVVPVFQELPKRISTEEEAEVLSLLCKVHELEIGKVEMQSEALLKEHEVRRRDLLILKYNKQRSLCDEIIQRQKALIEGEYPNST